MKVIDKIIAAISQVILLKQNKKKEDSIEPIWQFLKLKNIFKEVTNFIKENLYDLYINVFLVF